ncbi:MAG: hypothetical protein JKY48_03130 [Flavobacteriales bacterium]|nr:hypothetical protein [Flavobacteriales bacterium]
MNTQNNNKNFQLSIWGLALGYFLFYVPYSGLIKVLSSGLFPGTSGSITGFEMLPAVLIGTVVSFLIILAITKWWKFAGSIKMGPIKIPFATNPWTFFSGVTTAVIIATTTLAYSFTGISIVFAALLMRGGVLILAPFIDTVYRRNVYWYSWVAFGLTMCSLLMIFTNTSSYKLSLVAGINIAAYLSGYFFRLQFMTHTSKTENKDSNNKYFTEEMISALTVLLIVPILIAFFGSGEYITQLRTGYLTLSSSAFVLPSLLIGVLYACLYVFGSRIYLNHRENTFCIPVNRCASLLAGVCAAIILSFMYDKVFFNNTQLISAGILVLAVLFMRFPAFFKFGSKVINFIEANLMERSYLFVCPGNTGRSPMAEAIFKNKVVKVMRASGRSFNTKDVKVMSAGICAEDGNSLNENARKALARLGIKTSDHQSQFLSQELIDWSDKIFCMTEEHRKMLIEQYPLAETKVMCLDPEDAIPNPHGLDHKAFINCAKKIQQLIEDQIFQPEVELS